MIQSLRVLNAKDTESPLETIISGVNPLDNIVVNSQKSSSGIAKPKEITDNFDTFIEKRK